MNAQNLLDAVKTIEATRDGSACSPSQIAETIVDRLTNGDVQTLVPDLIMAIDIFDLLHEEEKAEVLDALEASIVDGKVRPGDAWQATQSFLTKHIQFRRSQRHNS